MVLKNRENLYSVLMVFMCVCYVCVRVLHAHFCTATLVRTFIDILHFLIPYPNLNYKKTKSLTTTLILLTLKPSVNPKTALLRPVKRLGPAKMPSLSWCVIQMKKNWFSKKIAVQRGTHTT